MSQLSGTIVLKIPFRWNGCNILWRFYKGMVPMGPGTMAESNSWRLIVETP